MRAIFLLELVFVILFAWGFATQVVIPYIEGEKFFPFVRNRRKLENDLVEANTKITDRKIEKQLNKLLDKLGEES